MEHASGSSQEVSRHETKGVGMKLNLQKLIAISSNSLNPGSYSVEFVQSDINISFDSELSGILSVRNGFYAFESALHVFPANSTDEEIGLVDWNNENLWKSNYDGLASDLICFGEDVFANQFAFRGNEIVRFNPETAEKTVLSDTLDGWAGLILSDYEFMTGHRVAKEWQAKFGKIPSGKRLCPIKPFAFGGEFLISNLKLTDTLTFLLEMGNLARQISELPNGARVRLIVGSPPHSS